MATAKKSQPLSIDDLISAQQSIASSSSNENDIKKAEEQIERLMRIKGDSTHVTLGDVKNEVKGLREDLKKTAAGKEPADNRRPLLSLVDTPARSPSNNESTGPESRDARRERMIGQGNKIDQRTQAGRGGARNEGLNDRNKGTFEKFVAESGKKNDFMADATEKQTEIFKRIEDTLLQLRGAGTEDSKKLREELDNIANELHDTDETGAKAKVTGILQNARQSAATGTRNETGTLGDAYAALRGKKDVLKEGFSFDSRTGTARNDATGQLAGKDAKMGKLKGAATILGSYIGNKVEESVESKRSPGFQKFLGNFRQTELPEVTGTGEENKIGAAPTTGGSAIKGATGKMEVQTLNVTAKVVNIADARAKRDASAKPAAAKPAGAAPRLVAAPKSVAAPAAKPAAAPAPVVAPPPPTPVAKAVPMAAAAAPAAATATAAPAEEGGGVLGTVADIATSGGGGMLSKAGSVLKAAGPGLLKGGVAALGGAALSYGGDKLKEAGYEKTGAAADIAGQAATWGGTGAMMGSVIPGVGTAIGAGVGAVAGGAYGLYKNWGSLFGGKKEGEAQAAPQAAATPTEAAAQPKETRRAASPEDAAVYGKAYDNARASGAGVGEAKKLAAEAVQVMKDQRAAMAGSAGPEARAAGGPVVEGKSYLVGEKGPEIMTPQKSGKITPNNLSDLKGKKVQDSYADQDGNMVENYEDGTKVVRNKNGEVISMSSGSGNTQFAGGKATKHSTPSMMGYGEEHDLQSGNVTKNYNQGPLSVKETSNASGKAISRSSEYDLGVARVNMDEDLVTGKKRHRASAVDASGQEQSVEGESAEDAIKKLNALLEGITKSDSGNKIGGLSADNAMAKDKSGQPIVINQAPAAPAAPAQQTTMVPRGNVRPQESALESYNRRSANY